MSIFPTYSVRASDDGSIDLEKRPRNDSDPSKSKKKHKKHKKHKKSKKHETDERDKSDKSSSKKHKKHRKHSSEDIPSGTNSDSSAIKAKATSTNSTSKNDDTDSKLPPRTTASTLNNKFTEIMKSNGHVVVATIPTTKFNNGNQLDCTKRSSQSGTTQSTKVPTDPNELVAFIASSLESNVVSHVISSASESGSIRDVDSPDVTVIEDDDLNLEELMRQKALLQARLGTHSIARMPI